MADASTATTTPPVTPAVAIPPVGSTPAPQLSPEAKAAERIKVLELFDKELPEIEKKSSIMEQGTILRNVSKAIEDLMDKGVFTGRDVLHDPVLRRVQASKERADRQMGEVLELYLASKSKAGNPDSWTPQKVAEMKDLIAKNPADPQAVFVSASAEESVRNQSMYEQRMKEKEKAHEEKEKAHEEALSSLKRKLEELEKSKKAEPAAPPVSSVPTSFLTPAALQHTGTSGGAPTSSQQHLNQMTVEAVRTAVAATAPGGVASTTDTVTALMKMFKKTDSGRADQGSYELTAELGAFGKESHNGKMRRPEEVTFGHSVVDMESLRKMMNSAGLTAPRI